MGLNSRRYPYLYSTMTELAYKVAKEFYNGTQYAWCATEFNAVTQPATSDPAELCNASLKQISRQDRHATQIDRNKVGILRGAEKKLRDGVVNEEQYKYIQQLIEVSEYKDYMPIIIVVISSKVKIKCKEVPIENRASDSSIEYIIDDLQEGEFLAIHFDYVMNGIFKNTQMKAGA